MPTDYRGLALKPLAHKAGGFFYWGYMLEAIVINLIDKISGKTWDQIASSNQTRLLREVVHERILRELRLNIAVWQLFREKAEPGIVAKLISVAAFNEVSSLSVPLRLLFNTNSLSKSARDLLIDGGKIDGRYKKWSAGIDNEIDLIERIWHRLRVLEARQQLKGSLGNMEYLMHLHRVLVMALDSK
jgi:hypothetical protein